MLISIDVGDTLGRFDPPGAPALLEELSPLSRSAIAEFDRQYLHPATELTDEVISLVCRMLAIPRDDWRLLGRPGGFTAFTYTNETLAELAKIGQLVTLSNVSALAGPNRMRDVRAQCGRYLGHNYTSFQLGMRKPDPHCWQRIASDHFVEIGSIVHIGDRITEDVRGPLFAGCRGAILTNTRGDTVPDDLRADPRVAVVNDLRSAVPILRTWAQQTENPAQVGVATSHLRASWPAENVGELDRSSRELVE